MHPVTGKMSKMKIGAIKEVTPEAQPHMIPEVKKNTKNGSRVESHSTQKYNNRPRIQRIHHVTTLKNAPTVFPIEQKKRIFTEAQTTMSA